MKIVSDGTNGTKLLTDDGQEVEGVVALTWSHQVDDFARIDARLSIVKIEAVGAETRFIGPNGKAIRRIEYADGTFDEYPAPTQ